MNHWETSEDSARRLLAAVGFESALHEAGHAVAQLRFEILGDEVKISPSGDTFGTVDSAGARPVRSNDEAAARVLSCCAGFAALVATGHDKVQAAIGCDSDFLEAANLIKYWALEGDLETWKRKAVRLMRFPRNIAAVEMVAAHLLRQRVLAGDYVEVLVDLADGSISQADFDDFLALRGRS